MPPVSPISYYVRKMFTADANSARREIVLDIGFERGLVALEGEQVIASADYSITKKSKT
jgi:hypothetical protein